MNKVSIRNVLLAILFGVGFSFFTCTQYLGVWSTTPDKGILLLSGVWFLTVIIYFWIFEFILGKVVKRISSTTFSVLLILIIAVSGILLVIFPLPERKTPDVTQIIVIKPVQDANHPPNSNKILVEEIKINGNPIPLKDIKPSSGWQLTPYGLESEIGNLNPLVLKNEGELQSNILLLFGKGPSYGSTQIRMGWYQQQVDLFQPVDEAEISISIPRDPFYFWGDCFFLSLWIMLSGINLLLVVIILFEKKISFFPEILNRLVRSVLFWTVLSFLFWYGFSFVRMVFFNPTHVMINENFLPAIRPIGNDLDLILNASKSVAAGGSPYAGANKYPPAATVLFLPLAIFDLQIAFQIMTVVNYIFYAFVTLGFPHFLTNYKKIPSFAWILFTTGLFSYGLLFEIERGQFNLIAMGLAFLAILLFHKTPRFRWLSYIIVCISIQLKIYPAIFVIFLVEDWKDWKKNLLRWISLGLTNIVLLFILGLGIMQHYLTAMTGVISTIGKSDWPVSHSINGFMTFANYYFNFTDQVFLIIQTLLTAAVLILISICFYSAFARKTILDPYLLVACTLGALLLPALSNDYTLAYLVGPAIFLLTHLDDKFQRQSDVGKISDSTTVFLIGISALAFTSTYFSYLQKPILLQNQFPALFIFLVCTAVLSFKEYKCRSAV